MSKDEQVKSVIRFIKDNKTIDSNEINKAFPNIDKAIVDEAIDHYADWVESVIC